MGKQLTKSARLLTKEVGAVGEKTVRAVVTAPTLDRDGDIIDTRSLHLPLKGGGWIYASELTGNEELDIPFLLNHSFVVEDVIGSVRSGIINDAGELEVMFGVSGRAKAQDMFTLLDEGHLSNAFSITISYDYASIADGVIYDGEVYEISLVFKGSNRNARLLAVSKSLLNKESSMAADKPTLEELKEAQAKLTKAIEEAEAVENEVGQKTEDVVETKATDTDAKDDEADDSSDEGNAEAPTVVEQNVEVNNQPEVPTEEPVKEAIIKPKEDKVMTETESKSIAAKAAAAKPKDIEQPKVVSKVDKDAHKLLAYKQIVALKNRNWEQVAKLNEQAKKMDEEAGLSSKAIKSKEIGYSDAEPLYLVEQLSRDVEECRGDFGNLSSLVTTVNLTTSPKMRIPVVEGETRFVPVGWEGEKPEDSVSFDDVSVEPKPFAFIQVWSDHAAEDAQIALYDLMVRNVAEADAALDDELIVNFAGVTADGLAYPDQGILEQIGGGRVFTYDAASDTAFYNKLLAAMAGIRGCDRKNISLVMNSAKIFELAGMRTSGGDLMFTGNGTTLNLGIAGNVSIRTSDEVPVSDVIVGNFRRYYLGKKEGLSLTTNNLGVVGGKNLYTTDKTALRAVVRREGAISDQSLAGSFTVLRSDLSS